ncbi:MAG TPA: hypothetical protein QGH10_04955, partial [Armatimonadota bacterium]|nr:hypothetical protein [Armatimonadota bacterium]
MGRLALAALVVIAVVALGQPASSAGERRIRLNDHINRQWSSELVSHLLVFDPGTCHQSSLTLSGPTGDVAFQLSEVERDAEGFIISTRLSFVTDLPALGEVIYTLRYGSDREGPGRLPQTDLVIEEGSESVQLTTKQAGARLLSGARRLPSARPAREVPGPVLGLRALDGKWIGASSLYGGRAVVAYEAELVDAGPVFATARVVYTFADGETLAVRAKVVAGQEVVFLESESNTHAPEGGWRLNLSRGYPSPVLSVRAEHDRNKWGLSGGAEMGDIGHGELAKEPPGAVYWLTPWEDWWDGMTRTVFSLRSPSSDTVLAVGSHDPGAWNDPAWMRPDRRHLYPFVPEDHWERRLFKAMPLVKGDEEEISLQCPAHIGVRKWFVGFVPKHEDPDLSYLAAVALHDSRYGCQTLNTAKDYVLSWGPGPETVHPHVYVSRREAAEARGKLGSDVGAIEGPFYRYYRKDDGERWRVSGRALMQHMVDSAYWAPRHTMTLEANSNKFDLMRHSPMLVNLFDALMASHELDEAERDLLRAQIAFLGYRLDSPYVWDLERGYAGDPNNMHMSYMCNLGLVACAIPGHPMARAWADKAIKWVETRMNECVGEQGVWTVENPHYSNVSLSSILPFAIAAQNAGFRDFLKDGKLRSWATYMVRQLTPRDPRYGNVRSLPPEQVQDRAERAGLAGVIAKATADSDPGFSEVMQWAWNEQGNPSAIADGRMTGFEGVVTDTSLGAAEPEWRSQRFPGASVIMRHGLGTPDEYYLALPICERPAHGYYLSQPGGVTIYGKGKPLALAFSGAHEVCTSESFLTNTVSVARTPGASVEERAENKGYIGRSQVTDFSAMPRQDYALAAFHLDQPLPVRPAYRSKLPALPTGWPRLVKQATSGGAAHKRQVLFVKGAQAHDATYFVFRDTVEGGQPTVWNMWTLSQKLGMTDETRDLEAFLSDAPGNRMTSARELD